MYGLTSTIRNAVTGLQVSQDGIGNAANNISNAHTKGYTRKVVEQQAQHILGLGAGVKSIAITRQVDAFIETNLRTQLGLTGRSDTIANYSERVQGLVFGDPSNRNTGLGSALDHLAHSIDVAANHPEKAAQRMAVIGAAQDVFNELARAEANTQELRQDADRRIHASVQRLNVNLEAIHNLNTQIARSQNPGELLDQRDMLVAEVARQFEITTHMIDDNRIAIYGPSGQPLLEYTPRVLEYKPAATVNASTTFGSISVFTRDPATQQIDPASGTELVGLTNPNLKGELGGLLEMRDRALPELSGQLRELGQMLRFALDAAHNEATPLPPPATLTAARTEFPPATFAGTAHVATVDPTTGEVTEVGSLDLGHPAFAAVTTAAEFAAALNAQLDPDVVATVVDGQLTLSAPAGRGLAIANGTAAITIDGDERGRAYGFSHFFGLNDFVTQPTGDPTRLFVRGDIVEAPEKLASSMLDVALGPPASATLGGAGDNRGLHGLAAALDRPLRAIAQGGLPAADTSMRNYLADLVGFQAVRAEQATRAASNDRVLFDELEFRKAGVSGVNVDEEMAHLMILQQAYTASARVITIADRLLEELLSIKR
ncbi:MAG: flagellar hook-associated protein FlgK [Geminicoccaceae bacterium]|nr:MAG: flagellar hook-associated protein FlgK [Geminicoccaceae bacterium]